MKNLILCFVVCLVSSSISFAQSKYFTRDGNVSFTSTAPLETIEAHNSSVTSVLDIESGKIQFSLLIKAFEFKKALMEEHFNENYMESDKFPKSTFKGQIDNLDAVDFSSDGEYPVSVSGTMTIHGVSNALKTEGTILIQDGKISAKSAFNVLVADYNIVIPKLVRDNIAKIVNIVATFEYQLFEKS